MSTATTVPERVAAGAAFLDEHDPDWWRAGVPRAINLETLNLWNGNRCVLGQRCPLELADMTRNPYLAFSRLLSGLTGNACIRWAQDLGFHLPLFEDRTAGDNWDSLTAEWKRVITERRAAA